MQSSISHFDFATIIQNFAPAAISLGVAHALLRPRTDTFWLNKWGRPRDLTMMLQAVSLVAFLTFKIDFNKNTETVTFLIPSQWTSILIITRWKRNKGFDESRFSHYPLSWESSGMVERIKNLLFGSKQLKKREVINILKVIETLPKEHVDKVCFSFFYLFKFPFIFIDAEEINANVDEKKIGMLVILRTRIIHKLTASCLQLSFHLTFKFLVLRTNRQFFLFFVVVIY